jgi:hypothetical protein
MFYILEFVENNHMLPGKKEQLDSQWDILQPLYHFYQLYS